MDQDQDQQHHQQQQHQTPRPLPGNGMIDTITRYPFLQHPTDANLGQWATAAAPLVTGNQAAALIYHTTSHAAGISHHLASHGITPTPRQDLVQSHLAFLRNQWPNGQWYPLSCTPSIDPPPLEVLTPMKTLTELWTRQARGRPLSDLWAVSPDPTQCGIIRQIVYNTRSRFLTRRVAEAALRRAKALFAVPVPPVKSKSAPPPPPKAPVKSESELELEAPRSGLPIPAEDLTSSPLRQSKTTPADHLALSLKRQSSPSPPPMPECDEEDESDVSVDGVLRDLFAQPGIPLGPTSKKFKMIREAGLAAAKEKKDKADAAARRRRSAEKEATANAAAAAAAANIGKEGLDADEIDDIAHVLGDAAAKAVSRAAKRHFAHLLPSGRRAVMTKRARRKIEEMVSEYL